MILTDNPAGWKRYEDYLGWHATEGPVGRNQAYVSLSKGWALGTKGFKIALIKDHALAATTRAWENSGATEMREQAWEELFQRALVVIGRKESELGTGPKSAPWKVAIATLLKERTQVSNPWLATRLKMDRPAYVSRLVSAVMKTPKLAPEILALRVKCTA